MYLNKIRLENYRNISAAEISLNCNISIFYGLNGQGKTNFLESVYLLGSGRSFRSAKIPDLIHHGQKQSIICAEISSGGINSQLNLVLSDGMRRIFFNGKSIYRATDLQGILPVVVFSPDDTAMIKLGPESRRRYLDRTLYVCSRSFLQCYHAYYRTLKQRNVLLRTGNRNGLEEWTEQLVESGQQLMQCRQTFVSEFEKLFAKTYALITGGLETVGLKYKADVQKDDFNQAMKQSLENDLRHGTTGRGPHRDDLQLLINERSLKIFGSQGQQRSYILALKMAELEYLQETFHDSPVLLLDDMASELDRNRTENLLLFLNRKHIQTMITTTDPTTLPLSLFDSGSRFRVEDGTLTYEETKS